jgi:hypothetical protein
MAETTTVRSSLPRRGCSRRPFANGRLGIAFSLAAASPPAEPVPPTCPTGDEQLMDQLAIDEDLPPLDRLKKYSDSDIALQRCGGTL